ncbi:hypothetical protein A4A49_58602, partial [Nicotiana attenuata]
IDHNHPLYLRESDTPAMRTALLVKNKLGFIEGTCVKSSFKGELENQWERCNVVERFDKSKLTQTYRLWKMIRSLTQGTGSVTVYYSKMKDLWDEMDLLVAGPGCDCEETRHFIKQCRNLRLLQFLVGLNESYSHVRSQVLLKTPVLTVNQAYALVIQKESQRTLGAKRPGLICEFCGYKGHLKENCYKIIGYPPDFRSKKKAPTQGVKPYANAATAEKGNASSTQSTQGNFFTEDQYKQLLNLLNKQDTGDCHSLMAGINALLSNAFDCEWILDSGASHHINFHKEIMHDVKDCNAHNDSGVQVPTGNKCQITHTGNVSILDNQVLMDVLHVPKFKFNLLSVSKLTKELCCIAMFFPDFCVLQGLYNGKVMGIIKESCGLYLL